MYSWIGGLALELRDSSFGAKKIPMEFFWRRKGQQAKACVKNKRTSGSNPPLGHRVTCIRGSEDWRWSLGIRRSEPKKFQWNFFGGERGIRTPGTVSRTHAFQACALNHSAISPSIFENKSFDLRSFFDQVQLACIFNI
jgi:hypothetical protein